MTKELKLSFRGAQHMSHIGSMVWQCPHHRTDLTTHVGTAITGLAGHGEAHREHASREAGSQSRHSPNVDVFTGCGRRGQTTSPGHLPSDLCGLQGTCASL